MDRGCEYRGGARSPLGGRPGGKFYLARRIVARFPAHSVYCEPFCGAAWVLFRKGRSELECLNDADRDIVNFFETVRCRFEELCARGEWVFHARETQRRFLAEPMPSWEEDAVERAFRIYYLQRTAYRGRCGYGSRPAFAASLNSHKTFVREAFRRDLELAARRLERVILECLDWRECLERFDSGDSFFYADPPYPMTSFSYGRDWSWEEYEELAERLGRVKGKFLLSINDLPRCREIFGRFRLERVSVFASLSSRRRSREELLAANYDYGQEKKIYS